MKPPGGVACSPGQGPSSTAMEYRVTVRGRLSDRLLARFDGLTVVSSGDTTVLAGDLVDQAQLHGILDRIRDLGLELLAVERCPSGATSG